MSDMAGAPREFSDAEYIEAIKAQEPASTTEIAEHVGCTNENARIRLKNLYEGGEIKRKTISRGWISSLIDNYIARRL